MNQFKRKYKKAYANELYKIAKGDLASAKALFKSSEGRVENVCYLAQQSVEKVLKAVLVHQEKEVVLTHDIEALLTLLPNNMLPPNAKELPSLTPYATVRRYEEGFELLSRDDIEQVLKSSEIVIDWASFIDS